MHGQEGLLLSLSTRRPPTRMSSCMGAAPKPSSSPKSKESLAPLLTCQPPGGTHLSAFSFLRIPPATPEPEDACSSFEVTQAGHPRSTTEAPALTQRCHKPHPPSCSQSSSDAAPHQALNPTQLIGIRPQSMPCTVTSSCAKPAQQRPRGQTQPAYNLTSPPLPGNVPRHRNAPCRDNHSLGRTSAGPEGPVGYQTQYASAMGARALCDDLRRLHTSSRGSDPGSTAGSTGTTRRPLGNTGNLQGSAPAQTSKASGCWCMLCTAVVVCGHACAEHCKPRAWRLKRVQGQCLEQRAG